MVKVLIKVVFMKIYLLILLVFLIGCKTEGLATQIVSIDSISVATDKPLYHSGEMIHITADINSPLELDGADIRFYGIYAKRNRLDQNKIVDLVQGMNQVVLDYEAPSCYGCSGIKPGSYQISVDVVYESEVLATGSIFIEIRQ